MTEIILDISANTHRNDGVKMRELFDSIPPCPQHHTLTVKTQMWSPGNPCAKINTTCTPVALEHFIAIGRSMGYQATSSVFDRPSLNLLLQFKEIPFVKIACRPDLYWLAGLVPRNVPVYVSRHVDAGKLPAECIGCMDMACIPQYPARLEHYHQGLGFWRVSDHTPGLALWRTKRWQVYECHYVLERDEPDNPDAGPFAKTPADLAEMFS